MKATTDLHVHCFGAISQARHRGIALVAGITLGFLAPAASLTRAEVLDDFADPVKTQQRWTPRYDLGNGSYVVTNGQVWLQVTPTGDHGFVTLQSLREFTVRQGHTLEFRLDLISTSHDGAMARLGFSPTPGASDFGNYVFFFDQDTGALVKRPSPYQFFWVTNLASINTTNVKLVLTLTGLPEDVVRIRTRVLDNTGDGAVLFDRVCDDTPQADPLERGTDSPPSSLLGQPCKFLLGIYHDNVGVFDPQVGIGKYEQGTVIFDNAEFFEYDSAWITGLQTVACLPTWSENTAEEQIVVVAASLDGPWAPWAEPIFKRFGQFSMAVPTTATQMFLKLVPGTQFMDDFNDLKQPFASRNDWRPVYLDSRDASSFTFAITNQSFQIKTLTQPLGGMVAIFPPGGGSIMQDFCASVDILSWASSQESALGIAGRVQGGPTRVDNAYLGSVRMNPTAGTGQLYFFNGASDVQASDVFSADPNVDYRLEFCVVGSQLTLRLFHLTDPPTLVRQGTLPDSRFTQGHVALWVNTRGSTDYTRTVDNLIVTGTKP